MLGPAATDPLALGGLLAAGARARARVLVLGARCASAMPGAGAAGAVGARGARARLGPAVLACGSDRWSGRRARSGASCAPAAGSAERRAHCSSRSPRRTWSTTLERALSAATPWEGWYEVAGPEPLTLGRAGGARRRAPPPGARPAAPGSRRWRRWPSSASPSPSLDRALRGRLRARSSSGGRMGRREAQSGARARSPRPARCGGSAAPGAARAGGSLRASVITVSDTPPRPKDDGAADDRPGAHVDGAAGRRAAVPGLRRRRSRRDPPRGAGAATRIARASDATSMLSSPAARDRAARPHARGARAAGRARAAGLRRAVPRASSGPGRRGRVAVAGAAGRRARPPRRHAAGLDRAPSSWRSTRLLLPELGHVIRLLGASPREE